MKHRKLDITALLLLFTFLLGTIGVNVSRVYCNRCQEGYLQVVVVPADVPCPCKRAHTCCGMCHNMHKKACDNAKQQHCFYKVSGDWSISHATVQWCDAVLTDDFMPFFTDASFLVVKPIKSFSLYIDTSPPLELLCIFRC